MYESFYGFREKPFHVTADPAFLYPSRHHQEAMSHLTYGIKERLGFLMITGEVGTGKTTLAKALIEKLPDPVKTALILNPALSGTQLLRNILQDFGASQENPAAATNGTARTTTRMGSTRGDLLRGIEQFLLEQARGGGTAVLIIDEAQALSTNALEQVRLLSNVETPKDKLLQIVLVGQPELSDRLAGDVRLRALHQRIAVRYHIQPMAQEEVAAYIAHRLKAAGAARPPEFTAQALEEIAASSGGFPRRINLLCDHILLAGFVQETQRIDLLLVKEAQAAIGFETYAFKGGNR